MFKHFSFGFIAGAVAGVLLAMLIIKTCSGPGSEAIASKFISYVSRVQGRRDLILAKKTVQEKIEKEIRSGSPIAAILASLFGPEIGVARIELTCFVEYNYYVDLDPVAWEFTMSDNTLRVKAPAVQLLKPPGLHTESIEARIKDRSVFISEKEHLREMKRFLSDTLSMIGEQYKIQVQDTCRVRLQEILMNFSRELESQVEKVEVIGFGEISNSKRNAP